jgi:hypothetical protein
VLDCVHQLWLLTTCLLCAQIGDFPLENIFVNFFV